MSWSAQSNHQGVNVENNHQSSTHFVEDQILLPIHFVVVNTLSANHRSPNVMLECSRSNKWFLWCFDLSSWSLRWPSQSFSSTLEAHTYPFIKCLNQWLETRHWYAIAWELFDLIYGCHHFVGKRTPKSHRIRWLPSSRVGFRPLD